MDLLRAEAKLFEIQRGRPIRVKALTRLLSNIMFQGRGLYMLGSLVGGFDDDGPQVFYTDFVGSVIPDKFVSILTLLAVLYQTSMSQMVQAHL